MYVCLFGEVYLFIVTVISSFVLEPNIITAGTLEIYKYMLKKLRVKNFNDWHTDLIIKNEKIEIEFSLEPI